MKWLNPEINEIVHIRTGTINPLVNPETEYELFSIPGYDKGKPEIKMGGEILSNKTVVQTGDVLFSKLNPRIPRIWIVPRSTGRQQISSTEFWPLVCNGRLLANQYLRYYLLKITEDGIFSDAIEAATKSRSRIKPFHLLRQRVPLPPLSEQRRIVEILDQADALRKKRAEADAKSARLLPALFYQMFGDPATNPKGWPVHPFRKLFSQDKTAVDKSTGKGLPFLGLEHIESDTGRILFSEAQGLSVDVKGLAFRFGPQHILYGKLRPYLNKVALPSFEGRCSTELVPLLPAPGVPREFVAAYLRLPYVVNAAMATNKGARMPRTDMHLLMAMEVPIPDEDSQRAFAVACATVSKFTERSQDVGRCVERLFSILLHRAFTGDLTAKWREAHMKELLAEMEIQARALNSLPDPPGDPTFRL